MYGAHRPCAPHPHTPFPPVSTLSIGPLPMWPIPHTPMPPLPVAHVAYIPVHYCPIAHVPVPQWVMGHIGNEGNGVWVTLAMGPMGNGDTGDNGVQGYVVYRE